MNFLYDLYQNDNFTLYLTIALIVLVILFVIVLVFGKKDQKLEETKRLEKISMDSFKEENTEPVKVEVEAPKVEPIIEEPVVEDKAQETKDDTYKSFFDETQVMPTINDEVVVTTFEPEVKTTEEVVSPILTSVDSTDDLNEVAHDVKEDKSTETIEINLSELNSIKNEFDEIKIPEKETEEVKEEKKFKPQSVFSSVFVEKPEPIVTEEESKPLVVEEEGKPEPVITVEEHHDKPKSVLFAIDDDDVDLPSLKTK